MPAHSSLADNRPCGVSGPQPGAPGCAFSAPILDPDADEGDVQFCVRNTFIECWTIRPSAADEVLGRRQIHSCPASPKATSRATTLEGSSSTCSDTGDAEIEPSLSPECRDSPDEKEEVPHAWAAPALFGSTPPSAPPYDPPWLPQTPAGCIQSTAETTGGSMAQCAPTLGNYQTIQYPGHYTISEDATRAAITPMTLPACSGPSFAQSVPQRFPLQGQPPNDGFLCEPNFHVPAASMPSQQETYDNAHLNTSSGGNGYLYGPDGCTVCSTVGSYHLGPQNLDGDCTAVYLAGTQSFTLGFASEQRKVLQLSSALTGSSVSTAPASAPPTPSPASAASVPSPASRSMLSLAPSPTASLLGAPSPQDRVATAVSGPGCSSMLSLGSAGHAAGRCKPCAFFHTVGCENGVACIFCHLCEAGEKRARRKQKIESRRSARKLRQVLTSSRSTSGRAGPQLRERCI